MEISHHHLSDSLANVMNSDRRRKPYTNSSSHQSSKASLIMAFISCLAWLYVAGRLWQDAGNRALLSNLLHKNSRHLPGVVTVEDKLVSLGCKEIGRKIVEAQMDLTLAKSQGYLRHNESSSDRRLLAVIGAYTGFGSRLNRKRFRASWMPRGDALKKLEEKGVVIRFVIGRSPNRGDSLDRNIDNENHETKDFLILIDPEISIKATRGEQEVRRTSKASPAQPGPRKQKSQSPSLGLIGISDKPPLVSCRIRQATAVFFDKIPARNYLRDSAFCYFFLINPPPYVFYK